MSISKRDLLSGYALGRVRGRSAIAAGPAQPSQLGRGRLRWRASSALHKDGSEDRPSEASAQTEPSAKDRSPGSGFVLALVLSTVVWFMFLAGLATLLVRALLRAVIG